jgi:hypothetical protein
MDFLFSSACATCDLPCGAFKQKTVGKLAYVRKGG